MNFDAEREQDHQAASDERGRFAVSAHESSPSNGLRSGRALFQQNNRKKIYERNRRPQNKLTHERRILLMSLAAAVPAVIVALTLLWMNDYAAKTRWTLSVLILFSWLGFSFALKTRVVRPLQTIANLLAALGEGDYSIRARGAQQPDALGEVLREVNALSETLREQRLGAMEATTLLRTVMSEIDVAIFAFDEAWRLRLINRAGEKLLAQQSEKVLGLTAARLGLEDFPHELDDQPSNLAGGFSTRQTKTDAPDSEHKTFKSNNGTRIFQKRFPGSANERWGMRRSRFRLHGRPHELLVLADLSHPLREEERAAWQRLVRVLGHELNNSLAPIKSIAGSLATLIARKPRPADWQTDVERGLQVVASRSESLSRFMEAYSRVARLPAPRLAPMRLDKLVRRVVQLETRLRAEIVSAEEITINADADQIEQLIINITRNAVDAALATGGKVRVGWRKARAYVEVFVEDEGLGIANTANLFVPFFTTKPEGTGIGLVLSRQIAEAHNGSLTLENRKSGKGSVARLRLPR
jgi:nitrogen fixation/metabolism regulation signal transduction histidine kinase